MKKENGVTNIQKLKWKCSLCPTELPDDDLIVHRKKRHNEKHTRGWNYKERNNGGGNNTVGIPKWKLVN